ncbi:MAG TPA: hypothetical protein VMI92_12165, partial [Steroidobacteraceae bacterium]|nr:hypothetical protein [Steroidobacteraceae bacterium]
MNDARDLRWLALPLLTVWLVTQCYSGLWHDSVLYSFQAMAHLHPELLGNDLYLRYGSQDQYSVFPRLYAILIRWLGLENAAELLTLAMQALLLYAIWRLAVRLMPHNVAVFALAAAICLPNGYGAREVFHYIESFVTPRMAAEALTLCALAGWLRSPRSWWSLLLWLGACVLHPLMALAGAVMAVWLFLLDGRRRLAALLVVLGLATVLLASRFDSWRMDDYWFATIRAGLHYLMLGDWNEPSFVTTLLPLVLLGCAVRALAGTLPGQAAAAALATGVSGLVLTYLGA